MDLTLTDEQELLRSTYAGFLAKESTPDRVRAAEPLGFDRDLWNDLVGLGLLSMAVPVADGGEGAGLVELVLVTEELGRTLAPVPAVEVSAAVRSLARVGATPALAAALADELRPTVALAPARGGIARMVPAGAVADVVIALHDGALLLAGPEPAVPHAIDTMGATPIAHRTIDGPGAGPCEELVAVGGAEELATIRREWHLLTAATLVGLGAGALDLAVQYVGDRKQFGVAIGTFQTIAHRLADAATLVDGARLLVQEAAWAADGQRAGADELATMAFLFAAESARHVARESLQFHGGYGFMLEYDVQLYVRRARAWPLVAGDPRRRYAEVAKAALARSEGVAPWTLA